MSEMLEFGESAKVITNPNWSVFAESSKAKVNSIFGNRSEETTVLEFGESAKVITNPNWSVFAESSRAKVNSIFGNRSEETTAMQSNRPGRLSLFGEPKEEANVDFASQTTAMQSNRPGRLYLFGKPEPKEEANVGPMVLFGGSCPVPPLKEGDKRYDDLCLYSSIAIEKFNFDHNTKYKFGKYVKARMALCAGINYYITFTAKEDGDESPTAFYAMVYYGMQKDIQVVSVVKKKLEEKIANEDGDGSPTAFHTIVCRGIQKDIQVMSVMEKSDYKSRGYSRENRLRLSPLQIGPFSENRLRLKLIQSLGIEAKKQQRCKITGPEDCSFLENRKRRLTLISLLKQRRCKVTCPSFLENRKRRLTLIQCYLTL